VSHPLRWLSIPLAPLALAFAGGIALAPSFREHTAWLTWAAGLLIAAILALADRCAVAVVPLLAATVAVGTLRAASPPLPPDHVARSAIPTAALIEGRLAAEPVRWTPDRTRLLIDVERVDGLSRSGRLQATIYGELPDLTKGQRVATELRLREAIGFRNPGVFDYATYLAREGIHLLATGRADRLVALDGPDPPWPVRVRRRALQIMRDALPPTSAALLGGLLLGERTALPREIDDAFRRAGVYHVLAVSGFNVALLAASVFTALTLARAGRRGAAVGAMAAIIAFAAVVGPEPSVLRATVMGVLILGAMLLEREASVLNSLALAALVVLALRPADLHDPGFQLSFVATAAIVLAPLPRNRLLAGLGVSMAAQLAVFPIALAHFNQVSTIGVIANVAAVPLAGLATVLGLAGVALATVLGAAGRLLLNTVWPVLLALRGVVQMAASVPGAVVHLPAPHWTAVVAYTGALGLALTAWRLRGAAAGRVRALSVAAGALLLTAALIAAWPLLRPPDGRLRITILDVGQGDAIVLEAPDGRAALLDAGPGGPYRLDAGERVVAPFLWNRGHLSLSSAIATHADVDHAGGLAAIRRRFRVREHDTPEALAAWAGRAGVDVTVLGGSSAATPNGAPTRNDAALVLRVELGLASFLLASDMTARTEEDLLRRRAPLAATVLKVAHHGARSSSTMAFLDTVRPLVAVISVGTRNAYGHPGPETLARLRAAGASVYRTDRDGAVMLDTDGRSLTVTAWASRRRDRYRLDPKARC
jgi:competence protein ComEC